MAHQYNSWNLYTSIPSYSHDRFKKREKKNKDQYYMQLWCITLNGNLCVFYFQGWVKSMLSLFESGQGAMTPGFDVSDHRRNQIMVGGLICEQIWASTQWHSLSHLHSGRCPPSPSTSFSFHSAWDLAPWPDHSQSLKWILDRSTLDHRNEVISLQMSLLDWIYYQSFTSDIAWAITSPS